MIPRSTKPGVVSPRPLTFRCGDPRCAVAAIMVYVLTFDPRRELTPDQRDHPRCLICGGTAFIEWHDRAETGRRPGD